ncbi:hypothetical protein GOP47_0016296 [Adiantum capillus-veneris]|uniref:Uncharacterized protein n=1 Tax=Adiantum capillus-veneris TaxID=13818 RepID=A0A9D4UIH0_ADICA|nr:hypothetical protein GOP47_0016296 [Adiantum capillus-veneris]
MPGAGVKPCTCGHGDAVTVSLPHSSKDASPKKHAFRKDDFLNNLAMNSDAYDSLSTPSNECPHLGALNSKWHLNHWWEAPSGTASRGRAASCMFTNQDPPSSPAHSDLTFEAGTIPDFPRDNAFEGASMSTPFFPKAGVSGGGERVGDASNDPNTSTASRLESLSSFRGGPAEVENKSSHPELPPSKDRTSRWMDENGKMAIQSEVFDAILPSSDEVSLQWRISELRTALRASESARLESELETEALRKYVAEVEAAAAGLQSRVQELEHLMTFSAKDESRELEQLRAKIVMEVSKDTRSQSAKAARAIAAAREATMELDKVKRHASSLVKSQEEEAERLRMEAAECRTLYHARATQLQVMKEQIEKLEQNLKNSSSAMSEALKASHEEVLTFQKLLEAAKMEGQEKSKQLADLLEAFEIQSKALQSTENRLKEVEREKIELNNHSEWLEQQVAELRSQGEAAADYDRELRKVRAMLGAEKQHLLMELATLRRGNQSLQVELVEWQEKFHNLSQQVSVPMGFPTPTKAMDGLSIGDASEFQSKIESQEGLDNFECSKSATEEKVIDGQDCMTPTTKDTARSSTLCSCQKRRMKQSVNNSLNGHCSLNSKISGRKVCGLQEHRARGNAHHQTSCNLLKDDLLAAAHREIVKLKEINQCIVDARHGKMWRGNSHPEKENFFQK